MCDKTKRDPSLNPLVREMILLRRQENSERVEELINKSYTFHNIFHAICPADSEYGPEIRRLLEKCMSDSVTLDTDNKKSFIYAMETLLQDFHSSRCGDF